MKRKRTSKSSDKWVVIGEIDVLAGHLNTIYESLTPQAQSAAISLSHSMSNLRERILNGRLRITKTK